MAKLKKVAKESLKNTNANKRKKEKPEKDAVEKSSTDVDELPLKKKILKKMKIKSPKNEKKKAIESLNISKKSKTLTTVGDEQEIEEPTAEELLESEKPENVKAVLTVRGKKRQKHQQRLNEQKDKLPSKEVARNEEYLLKWKNNREEWKFEKLRQVAIERSVFDDTKISSDFWPIALEYLSGSKGVAKDKMTKAAEAVIDEIDKEVEKGTDDNSTLITSSEKYRRARELLQSFD